MSFSAVVEVVLRVVEDGVEDVVEGVVEDAKNSPACRQYTPTEVSTGVMPEGQRLPESEGERVVTKKSGRQREPPSEVSARCPSGHLSGGGVGVGVGVGVGWGPAGC